MKNFAPQLTRKAFHAILDAHGVAKAHRKAIAALVYHGQPVGPTLHAKLDGRWRRSRKNGQYAKCMEALLAALSAPFLAKHRFPPPDWQPSKEQLAAING